MNLPTINIPELQTKDGQKTSLCLEPLTRSNKIDYARMLYHAYQDYNTVQFLLQTPLKFKASRYKCGELADNYLYYNQYYSEIAKIWCIKQHQATIGCINFIAQNPLDPTNFERTILMLPSYSNQGLGKPLNIISYDIMFKHIKAPAILLQCAPENEAAIALKNTLHGWQALNSIDVTNKMIAPEVTRLVCSQLTRQDYLNNKHNITVPAYQIIDNHNLSADMGYE